MLTAAGYFRRPGTKRRRTMTERDQTPGITGDDTKDDDAKSHVVRGGTDHDAQGDDPDSPHTQPEPASKGKGTGHVCPRVLDECPA
jgi:hypothetical protein